MSNHSLEKIVVADHIHDNGTTVVRVELVDDLGPIADFVGTAQKHPDDKNDPELGYCIAYGRAVAKVAKHVEKIVEGRVAQADHERKHAKKVAADKARYRKRFDKLTSYDLGVCSLPSCFCKRSFDEWYAATKRTEAQHRGSIFG